VKGCENFHGKFKGYENVSPFSEKHSNRLSGLKKDRPLGVLERKDLGSLLKFEFEIEVQ
jgi:hypothetical protein